MCVTCLAFSAMTFFSPVTEVPQSTNELSASVSNVQAIQGKSMPVALEARLSITEMLKRIPNSPETRVLREEFKSLQAKLDGVKDDAKAEAIIDDGLNALSKRIMAEPNSDQLTEVLFEIQESKNNQQAAHTFKLNLLQSRGDNLVPPKFLNRQRGNWGWLS
ncbi:MAG TPA: hypothetical protein V6D03_11645 [Candidatus Caenarcaniphilales bacterium]